MQVRLLVCWLGLVLSTTPDRLDAQSAKSVPPPDTVGSVRRVIPSGVWQPMTVETKASLRGLCVFDDQTVWASGTGGTILCSYDQGQTWRVQQVPGAEALDFRDLQVIDPDTVVAMTSGTPARIYRTDNRGQSWNVVYESLDPKVFLDSLSFLDPDFGLVMGDPVDGSLFLLKTDDGGKRWSRVEGTPKLEAGEAGFAASGTNMTTWGRDRIFIALGGGDAQAKAKDVTSRILITDSSLQNWQAVATPLPRHESGGIFSLVMIDAQRGVAVGGDYKDLNRAEDHFALTDDGGLTWRLADNERLLSMGAEDAPTGFRSCVTTWKRSIGGIGLMAVGPSGTDLSADFGRTWFRGSEEGFHAAQFSPSGKVGWGVGSEGRISKWLGD